MIGTIFANLTRHSFHLTLIKRRIVNENFHLYPFILFFSIITIRL